ncbi:MAG: hypothetical protein Fur0042_20660 [Cyanophyceae cyanobacterium]
MKRQLLPGSMSFALTLGLGLGGLIQGTTAQGPRELSPPPNRKSNPQRISPSAPRSCFVM